jgi:hypothetical protein
VRAYRVSAMMSNREIAVGKHKVELGYDSITRI